MVRSTLLWIVAAACVMFMSGRTQGSQGPVVLKPQAPPANTTVRDLEYAVTLQGCIHGKRLTVDATDATTRFTLSLLEASEFTLEGPKELMQQLARDHDGHQDEITGVVIVPGGRQREGDVTIREIDPRTRIIAGGRRPSNEGVAPIETKSRILRLKVASLEHVDDACHVFD
jgi:hypothetical protein